MDSNTGKWDVDPDGQLREHWIPDLDEPFQFAFLTDWEQPSHPSRGPTQVGLYHGAQYEKDLDGLSNLNGWDSIATEASEVDRVLSQVASPSPLPVQVLQH
jgi:hypothetical protein